MSIVYEPTPTDIRDFSTASVFELRVILVPEENGYCALARDLPGVASQGDTIDEAMENIREACIGALEVYKQQSAPIPWTTDHVDLPPEATQKWILVNA